MVAEKRETTVIVNIFFFFLTNSGSVATQMASTYLSERVVLSLRYMYGGEYENFHSCEGVNTYVLATTFRCHLLEMAS